MCLVVVEQLKWKVLWIETEESIEKMCKTEPFQEDPSPVVILHDGPLSMKDFNAAKVYDFDFKYGQKSVLDFREDLAAIDLSMMQTKPVVRRRRIVKKRKYPKFGFVPSLEDIKENELFEISAAVAEEEKKDLAAIHRERALSCGMSVKEPEGRRHRHRRHSRR